MSKTRIQNVMVKDIYEFTCQALEAQGPEDIAPLSRHRARAWTKNPCAAPDDIALLVAYAGDRCTGYLGLVPMLLRADGKTEKVYWTSTFYVAPEYRTSGVGALLVMRMLALPVNLAATCVSEQAQVLYEKLNFQSIAPLDYYALDLQQANIPLRLIRKAVQHFNKNAATALEKKGGLGLSPIRALLYRIFLSGWRKRCKEYSVRQIQSLSENRFEVEQDDDSPVRFFRNMETINWMLEHHWVTTQADQATPNYYFDDYRECFSYRVLEVMDSQQHNLGFVILWLSRRHGCSNVQVLDYHFYDTADKNLLFGIVIEVALMFKADRISLPDDCVTEIFAATLARHLFKKVTRAYHVRFTLGSQAKETASRLSLNFCDGDAPFA